MESIFILLQDQDKAGTVDSAEESLPSAVNTQVFVTKMSFNINFYNICNFPFK